MVYAASPPPSPRFPLLGKRNFANFLIREWDTELKDMCPERDFPTAEKREKSTAGKLHPI